MIQSVLTFDMRKKEKKTDFVFEVCDCPFGHFGYGVEWGVEDARVVVDPLHVCHECSRAVVLHVLAVLQQSQHILRKENKCQ